MTSSEQLAEARSDVPSVVVLNAGALGNFVEKGLGPTFCCVRGITVRNESGPSVGLATAIRARTKAADVYMSADAQVNTALMGEPNGQLVRWYVVFARNAVVLTYSPKSRYVADFERARSGDIPWHEVLQRPRVRILRGDPNLDPLAYYTLFVVGLAELSSGIPGLKNRILGADLNPAQLIGFSFAGLETGEVDAMFMYRNIVLDSQWQYIELPNTVNLSDASQAESYARVSFTNNQGKTFRGGPIQFSATILANATNPEGAAELVAYLVSPGGQELVKDYHFLPSEISLGGDPTSAPAQLLPFVTHFDRR